VEVDVNEAYINRVKSATSASRRRSMRYPDAPLGRARAMTTSCPPPIAPRRPCVVRIAFDKLEPQSPADMGIKVRFLDDQPAPAAGCERGAAHSVCRRSRSSARAAMRSSGIVNKRSRRAACGDARPGEAMARSKCAPGSIPGKSCLARGGGLEDGGKVKVTEANS